MKTTTFFVLSILLVAILPCFALDYTITFTGTGASTSVQSVIVQNLTKGTTVTVPAGNVLNLNDAPNAVEQLNANDETIRVYPNSVEGKSIVSFFAKQKGNMQINAFGMDGRKITGITANLQTGINSFQLSLPKGSFVIQVSGNGYTYTAKMINQAGTQSKPEIAYTGTEKPTSSTPQKSKSSAFGTTTMTYTTGDQLLYKATSGNYSTIVTDVPTTSKTTNFNFVACTDADGNNYTAVTIGTQIWMVENLKTTHFRDGSSIVNVTDNTAWAALTTGAWCDYSNITANGVKYGHLYNWYAVIDTRNIAPVGWHVPTEIEWTPLTNYVSANLGTSLNAAKALAATTDWLTSTTSGAIGCNLTMNNSTGFSALPGGLYNFGGNGTFEYVGSYGLWWSTADDVTGVALNGLSGSDSGVGKYYSFDKLYGCSVRCVKDSQ